MKVDGEKLAPKIMGAHHTQRSFDELAVACFGLAQSSFGGKLLRHIDAGGDDEGDLSLGVAQSGRRPRNAAEIAIRGKPRVLKGSRKAPSAESFEVPNGGLDFGLGDQLVPGITSRQARGKRIR